MIYPAPPPVPPDILLVHELQDTSRTLNPLSPEQSISQAFVSSVHTNNQAPVAIVQWGRMYFDRLAMCLCVVRPSMHCGSSMLLSPGMVHNVTGYMISRTSDPDGVELLKRSHKPFLIALVFLAP